MKLREASRDPRWPALRAQWLRAHPRCAICGTSHLLEVHHVKPVHLYPGLELSEANLVTLCGWPLRRCHFIFGHAFDWKRENPYVRQIVSFFDLVLRRSPAR